MATLIYTKGIHEEAKIQISGHSFYLTDAFSSEKTASNDQINIYYFSQINQTDKYGYTRLRKKIMNHIEKFKYVGFGQVVCDCDNGRVVIDCGITRVIHPFFLSPCNGLDSMGKFIKFGVDKLVGFKLDYGAFKLTKECHLEVERCIC